MSTSPNTPIRIEELETGLSAELQRLGDVVGTHLSLEPLGRQKAVADSTTKALARTAKGLPVAVILCSRPIAPDLAARGDRNAEAVRALVGDVLGQPVIKAIGRGDIDGKSYVIFPCCREMSSFRPLRVLQRFRLQQPLLKWLLDINSAAVSAHRHQADAKPAYREALGRLEQLSILPENIQVAVQGAIGRLESGHWSPSHTVDHNDFWLGNVMLPPRRNPLFNADTRFVLIDWVGANSKGYGVYDLARLALALKLSDSALRAQLVAHAAALGCDLSDTRGHLLAALGRLHINLEHFPERNYLRIFHSCWKAVERATADRDG